MNKRGQFYFLAAFLIISVIAGLITLYTNAQTNPARDGLIATAKEINFEMNKFIQEQAKQDKTIPETTTALGQFSKYYSDRNAGSSVYFVYGDTSIVTQIKDGTPTDLTPSLNARVATLTHTNKAGETETYNLDMNKERFYAVLISERNDERYVIIE